MPGSVMPRSDAMGQDHEAPQYSHTPLLHYSITLYSMTPQYWDLS